MLARRCAFVSCFLAILLIGAEPTFLHRIFCPSRLRCSRGPRRHDHHATLPLPRWSVSPARLQVQHDGSDVALFLQAANAAQLFDGALSAISSPLEHPFSSILGSYTLVTMADLIPFVPCQPLAIALGAKLGFTLAFPITAAGQTTAGILAFSFARKASNIDLIRDAASAKLEPDALAKFEKFRNMTAGGSKTDNRNVLIALIGLRLAPFFPFSAGNYLLGSTTAVPLSSFAVATLFGCLLSNLVSTSIGAGGAALLHV